ncbi:MAG TPA: TPM domain-containing protein, partial [Kofleriaceae bacterium]|nr:TPM domain-containing protein [Kofleriaceae bacterium]
MLAIVGALSAAIPASPTRWVEDHAAAMSPDARAALDARLEAYERATGHQVVVWIGRTIGGDDLAAWAVRTFAAWRLGRAGIDDGVAMFVLVDDRKIDLEVGYGLEARLPDAVAARIIREVMAPRMRAGQTDAAIRDGADAVVAAIEGHAWQGGTPRDALAAAPIELWIAGGLGVLLLLVLFISHPRLFLLALWLGRGAL